MQAALTGFFTIGSVVALGWLLAQLRVLGDLQRALLNRLAFLVASPALLFSLVSRARLDRLFTLPLLVSVLAIVAAGAVYLVLGRWLFGHRGPDLVIGWLCSCYTNAGNLGLPIAAAIMGDMTWMAPIMLVQVGLLQPVALAVLDARAATGVSRLPWWHYPVLPLRNPITAATLLGAAVNLSGWTVPQPLFAPIDLVGAMAVPAMLVAFGVSLRLDPLPGRGPHVGELWAIQAIKVVLHPLVAWLLAAVVFGLPPAHQLAVTVMAALPAAQNIFVIASRYDQRVLLARDAVFWSTALSVPVIVAVAAAFG